MQGDPPAKLVPSFGRRRGRKLRDSRSALIDAFLPTITLTPEQCSDLSSVFSRQQPLWFEIGFGAGEHLVEQARSNPHINFIGCEPYVNGMARLLVAIAQAKLNNIRLYPDDARLLLEKLPDESIERLFVLFPDPWPKARHHKRRIISQPTLELFHRKLAPGGHLRLATDHAAYGAWMLENILVFQKFEWKARTRNDWNDPPADWVTTRYQAKAAAEGRYPLFLDCKKA